MREFTEQDVAWLAGLLEGEGAFEWHKDCRPNRSHFGWPAIGLAMTDEDVVARAAKLMGVRTIQREFPQQGYNRFGKKTLYRARVSGQHAEKIMKILLPYMGKRRSEKIRELLVAYECRPRKRKPKYTCEILSSLHSRLQPSLAAQA